MSLLESPEAQTLIAEPDLSIYDKRKAQEDLGYCSRSLDQMIEDCYRWLIEESRLEAAKSHGASLPHTPFPNKNRDS